MIVETNLKVLKKTRAAPQVGDVFAMQLRDETFIPGLVVKANVPSGPAPMPGSNLVYIYNDPSTEPMPDLMRLQPGKLLLAPLWTNALGWSRGYFLNVAKIEVTSQHLLTSHCFWEALSSRYLDEIGNPIAERTEPCGDWALVSYRWIDDHVSDALHMPRAPEA